MTLSPARLQEALAAQREGLLRAARESEVTIRRYGATFDALRRLSMAELNDRLGGVPWPGARATTDLDGCGMVVPFPERWSSAQDARAWALERLRGVTTVGVDGSQIPASREFGVPVSLVQVGWFVNPHDAAHPYVKDLRDIVLTLEDGEEGDEYAGAESRINRCRFAAEMAALREQVVLLAGRTPPPVLYFDGTFVLSFAGRMQGDARAAYLDSLFQLLDASREHAVPVVGYVDASRATDLATLLRTAGDLPDARVLDGSVLSGRLSPFDRTAAFLAARGDILPLYRTAERDYSGDILFLYLQIGAAGPPARLDIPRWVLEAGILEHVIDVTRAEILVGSGYPYPLETADVAALLTIEERLRFYAEYAAFAQAEGIGYLLPHKWSSKARRR